MPILKGDIVNQAFVNLRISGLTTDASPEDTSLGLQTLEAMMLSWTNKGLNLSWNKSEYYTNPDPQEESGISDTTYEAAYINLACKLAPVFGKASGELKSYAQELYSNLFSKELPTQNSNPYLPVGQGFQIDVYDREFQKPDKPINVENDGQLDDLTI